MWQKIIAAFTKAAAPSKPNSPKAASHCDSEKKQMALKLAKGAKINALHAQMLREISLIELRELALDLQAPIENLPRRSDNLVFREFIAYMERHGRLPHLLTALAHRWPQVDWQGAEILQAIETMNQLKSPARPSAQLPQTTAVSPSSLEQRKEYRQMLEPLSLNEVQALCYQLSVDYEMLPGVNKQGKVRELIVKLERQNRLPELDPLLADVVKAADSDATSCDIPRIRGLIFETFPDDVALTDFCRQHLPQVVSEFGSGMSYRQKVQALLEYCALKKQFMPLLEALAAAYPAKFAAAGPYVQNRA